VSICYAIRRKSAIARATTPRGISLSCQTTRLVQTARPMAGKATKVSDNAGLDVLVGETNDGLTGYRRVDIEMTGLAGGGLRIQAEVLADLAAPIRQLFTALRGQRMWVRECVTEPRTSRATSCSRSARMDARERRSYEIIAYF